MDTLPIVIRATHEGAYKVRLTFSDGLDGIVDFAPWLDGPVF